MLIKSVLIATSLLMTGCAHTWNCADYGVAVNGNASVLKSISELPDSEIHKICGPYYIGCVKDGHVFYRNDDECALRHELCHIMQGNYHTVKYHQNLIAGKGNCPA